MGRAAAVILVLGLAAGCGGDSSQARVGSVTIRITSCEPQAEDSAMPQGKAVVENPDQEPHEVTVYALNPWASAEVAPGESWEFFGNWERGTRECRLREVEVDGRAYGIDIHLPCEGCTGDS